LEVGFFVFTNLAMPNISFPAESIFKSFENQNIMVVGDLMLDRYVMGRANRISPEAPVPVLDFEREEARLGGAANVALNILSLGATPLLFGVIGADESGATLLEKLQSKGIPTGGILVSESRMTTVKTRIMAGRQQLLRLDREQSDDLTGEALVKFIESAVRAINEGKISGLILQDYNKGVLTESVIEALLEAAKKKDIPIAVDPKLRNFWTYKGADIFKPNLKEVREALNAPIAISTLELQEAAASIRAKTGCKAVMITLSEQGLFYDDGHFSQIVGTRARLVSDPCGAGDTVISMAALALSVGLQAGAIAMLANLAGGQVVEKSGVVAVDKGQLMEEIAQHKFVE
jgi:D-glycero-beta-D-manno-heptose-7-phosphate kinase